MIEPRTHHDELPAFCARLARSILTNGFEGVPSLYATVFARGLAERFVRTIEDPSAMPQTIAWIERTFVALAPETRIAHMLATACANVAAMFRPIAGAESSLRILDGEIGRILLAHGGVARDRCSPVESEIDGTIAALLVRPDDADPLSAEHSRAVSLWCRRLALRLELDDDACRFAARCGLMHDVGKAFTPTDILNAPRSLSNDEWVIMREHTTAGARILAAVRELEPFVPAARSHHERLDGKGYPDRLPAREIPFVIRIVTVADSFNAMIGRRPYRLPLSPAAALEQLVRHRETQFDPTIVEAMIDIIEHPSRVGNTL